MVQRLDLTWPSLAAAGADRPDQYLFADGTMLVAPIIPFNGSDPVAKNPTNGTANASRTVWVPPGQWQDGWSSTVVSGVSDAPPQTPPAAASFCSRYIFSSWRLCAVSQLTWPGLPPR